MYFRHIFGSSANAFIRLELSKQGTLWQLLCRLPIEKGVVFGFLPKIPSVWEELHFAWHINHRADLENEAVDFAYRRKEAEYLANYLAESEGNTAVFYGSTFSPPQGPVMMLEGRVTTFYRALEYPNNYSTEIPQRIEAYYVIKDPLTVDEVEMAISSIEKMPFIGLLSNLPRENASALTNRNFDEPTLESLVDNTKAIWVSAYGEDVTLIWERSNVLPT